MNMFIKFPAMYSFREIARTSKCYRQTDRQTDGQRDRGTEGQTEGQTESERLYHGKSKGMVECKSLAVFFSDKVLNIIVIC